jgi:uncharacterized protein YjbI with pentapeptide repeats
MRLKLTATSSIALSCLSLWGSAIDIAPAQNRSRYERLTIDRDCQQCNLSNTDLHGLDLNGVKLQGANLSGASLRGTLLVGANLAEAKFIGADLTGAVLTGANISGATFRSANLENTILYRAKARQPFDISLAILKNTQFPSGKIVTEKPQP